MRHLVIVWWFPAWFAQDQFDLRCSCQALLTFFDLKVLSFLLQLNKLLVKILVLLVSSKVHASK